MAVDAARALRDVRGFLDRNHLQYADIICRMAIADNPENAELRIELARIAVAVGRPRHATQFLDEAAARGADASRIADIRQQIGAFSPGDVSQPRYLLIPEWGFGFWADVFHVLGSLLLAQATGRQPVVIWGDNSLFSPSDGKNAWLRYFEPISDTPLTALAGAGYSYFPPEWTRDYILSNRRGVAREVRKPGTYGIGLLGRSENVVVSDTHVNVSDVVPWLDSGDQYFGQQPHETMRDLMHRHVRLQPSQKARVELVRQRLLTDTSWLAVHYRGTDKPSETKANTITVEAYFEWIDLFLRDHASTKLLVLTDDQRALSAFRSRYGALMVTTDVIRSNNGVGVHNAGHDPVAVGSQVILDTYLATHCDFFLGNSRSNVSMAIELLKRWPPGAATLLGVERRGHRVAI